MVGTGENQTAVAPGTLRRTWTENNRRYFEYATDAPIRNEYAFFSADYAVREAIWNDVAIQIFYHPAHTTNLDRILRSAQASLEYHARHFGPYPNDYLRFVERSGSGIGMHSTRPPLTIMKDQRALIRQTIRAVSISCRRSSPTKSDINGGAAVS